MTHASHAQQVQQVFKNLTSSLRGPQTTGGLLKAIQSENPEDTGIYAGIDLLVDDKIVSVLTTEMFDVTLWVEDGQDVCFQMYPPFHQADFAGGGETLFRNVIEEPFKRVFRDGCAGHKRLKNVSADYYLFRDGHQVGLVHEKKRRGMDLLFIRFADFAGHYDWQERIIDLLKELKKHLEAYYAAGGEAT